MAVDTNRSRAEHRQHLRKLFGVARAALDLTQPDVADLLTEKLGRDVSVFRVSGIERGLLKPRADEVIALAHILHMPTLHVVFAQTSVGEVSPDDPASVDAAS